MTVSESQATHLSSGPEAARRIPPKGGKPTVNALGLHLLDYLQFTELSQVCAQIRHWSFCA